MLLRHLPLALTLALGVAAGAHAQAKRDTTYLPVWNQNNGKLEYLLQLEPADRAGVRWKSGANTFDATVGLDGNDGLGLVCDRKSGLAGAIGNLANHCLLASLDETWRAVGRAGDITLEQRMLIRLASTHALQQAKDVVDTVYHAAGASAIFASGPFERRFRDMHAITQQLQGRLAHFETVGQFLLGLDADISWL